jgi:hypothetical protein
MTTKLPRHSLLRRDLERLVAHGDWLPVGTIPHNVAVAELLEADGLIETRGEGRDRYARATDAGRDAL